MIDGAELLRFLAAFAVIGLALFAFAVLSRSGGRVGSFMRRERLVRVIETTPLPHAGSLHVVQAGDSYLLIGRTNGGISLLRELPADVVAARTQESAAPSKGKLFPRLR